MFNKLLKIEKSYNIIKKIKTCIICHKFFKNSLKYNLNIIKRKDIYKQLHNFKYLKNFNLSMNYITINLKNKYIYELSNYFNNIKLIYKNLLINLNKC